MVGLSVDDKAISHRNPGEDARAAFGPTDRGPSP